jgi:anti-sigma factor RsiW
MSEHSVSCEDRHDELAAYALDALDPAEARRLESHLASCPTCPERLRWLRPAVDVLPVTVAQQDPPEELRERLMAAVREEAAAAEPARTVAPAAKRRFRLPGFGEFGLRPALAGLALVLLLAAGIAGYALHGEDGTSSEQTYAARSTDGNTLAGGTLVVNGDEGSLEVHGMAPTKRGEVYQAWVRAEPQHGGSIEPSSVFVVADDGTGAVAIPHGLENAAEVMVTREPKGGSEHPSESAVISAEIG